MSYFREIPNLRYPSFLKEKTSSLDYVEAKNLFRRTKLRDDLQNNFTVFNKYEIEGEMRPDNVALELYGSDQFDWVVLIVAGITNVRNEWPLNNRDLYNYSLSKYGDSLNSNRFFETTEVKDSSGRMILPKGKVVDSNFTIPKPGAPTATLNPVVGISNYEYETRLNDEKRNIFILKPIYLNILFDDIDQIMRNKKGSTQFISETLVRGDDIRLYD